MSLLTHTYTFQMVNSKHRIENLKNLKTAAEVLTPFTFFSNFCHFARLTQSWVPQYMIRST
jgi:hypothetical protein